MPERTLHIATLLATLASATPAFAHDVTYELQGSGETRVVFHYQDGSSMAYAEYLLYAPNSGALPETSGLTDGSGAVAFRATADGVWKVEVHDKAGHASRARITINHGLPTLGGQIVPLWFVALSVLANLAFIARMVLARRAITSLPNAAGSRPT